MYVCNSFFVCVCLYPFLDKGSPSKRNCSLKRQFSQLLWSDERMITHYDRLFWEKNLTNIHNALHLWSLSLFHSKFILSILYVFFDNVHFIGLYVSLCLYVVASSLIFLLVDDKSLSFFFKFCVVYYSLEEALVLMVGE